MSKQVVYIRPGIFENTDKFYASINPPQSIGNSDFDLIESPYVDRNGEFQSTATFFSNKHELRNFLIDKGFVVDITMTEINSK